MTMLNGNRPRICAKSVMTCATVLVAAHFAGCAGIGPKTVARDRFDYVSAISESWKRQTLLNLLKTRYLDAPVFLDVGSVINQYAVEQELGLGLSGEFYNRGEPSFISPDIGVRGTYTDRPTITYNPLMGENFARSLLNPSPSPPSCSLLRPSIRLIMCSNPCSGHQRTRKPQKREAHVLRPAEPEFYELLILLRRMQERKSIVMRGKSVDGKEALTRVV